MMVVAVQAVNISFGLALGYGTTRRDFSLGTALTFIGLSIYDRWRQRGMLVFFAVLGILVLGAIALLTLTQDGETFGEFFANIRFISGYALSLIPTALAAAAGWAILHRATPRSSSTANRDQAPRLARGPSAARPFHPGHTGASVSAWPTPLPPPSCPSPSAAGCSGPPTLS